MIACLFQPNAPIEQQAPPKAADPSSHSDSSKPKQDRMIKYRIEKEKKSFDNLNIDMKEIFDELSQNIQQIRGKSNLVDELSLLAKDVDDDLKDDVEDEQETATPVTPEMERANTLYDQAIKLINGTTNRQYEV